MFLRIIKVITMTLPYHSRKVLWIRLANFAYAVLLLVWMCFLSNCSHQWHSGSDPLSKIPVRFLYTDAQARKVCVAGSFNNWSTGSDCLRRTQGDTWSLEILLPVGRYPYLFVINDAIWRSDPAAVLVEQNGFGGQNSVLVVE